MRKQLVKLWAVTAILITCQNARAQESYCGGPPQPRGQFGGGGRSGVCPVGGAGLGLNTRGGDLQLISVTTFFRDGQIRGIRLSIDCTPSAYAVWAPEGTGGSTEPWVCGGSSRGGAFGCGDGWVSSGRTGWPPDARNSIAPRASFGGNRVGGFRVERRSTASDHMSRPPDGVGPTDPRASGDGNLGGISVGNG
jgi:hypothetical protein